jgi:hypothetical protein
MPLIAQAHSQQWLLRFALLRPKDLSVMMLLS